jgi:hypothetical protein
VTTVLTPALHLADVVDLDLIQDMIDGGFIARRTVPELGLEGVGRLAQTGLVGGVHHEVDAIIWASGFETGMDFVGRAGYGVTGSDGRTLSAEWDVRVIRAVKVGRTVSSAAADDR